MNSIQKNLQSPSSISEDDILVSFEKRVQLIEDSIEIELLMKKLHFLGMNFDPFQNKHESECERILEQLDLSRHLLNPYLATNIVLRLLDITEERLNNLKQ